MEVVRKGLFEFMVEFDESEFALLKAYSDKLVVDIEVTFEMLIETMFENLVK